MYPFYNEKGPPSCVLRATVSVSKKSCVQNRTPKGISSSVKYKCAYANLLGKTQNVNTSETEAEMRGNLKLLLALFSAFSI